MRNDIYSNPLPFEKIIAILSYITGGMVGFIWIILGVILKQRLRPFMMFHVYQSIFLSILFFLLGHALEWIFYLVSKVPYIGDFVAAFGVLISMPLFFNLSILTIILLIILIYLCIGVVIGELSYIPWVSGIIRQNIER